MRVACGAANHHTHLSAQCPHNLAPLPTQLGVDPQQLLQLLVTFLLHVVESLDALQAAGLVFGDLKADNVAWYQGRLVVIDLGELVTTARMEAGLEQIATARNRCGQRSGAGAAAAECLPRGHCGVVVSAWTDCAEVMGC